MAQGFEAEFRSFFDRFPDPVAVHREGHFVYVNQVLVDALGYDRPEDLVGTAVLHIVHPDDREIVARRIRALASGARVNPPLEERFLCRDGSTATAEVAAMRIVFEGLPSVAVFSRDLTARRGIVSKMIEMDRLIALGTLAAGVGHEINNPLTYVIANLDFALRRLGGRGDGEDHQDVRELLEEAIEGARRVRDVVYDLRSFSRAHDDGHRILSVHRPIESALAMARGEMRHHARLSQQLGDVPLVKGSEARLKLAFLNLFINAIDSVRSGGAGSGGPEGGVPEEHEVSVRTYAEGAFVVVEVRDTGVGIAPERLPRVFDPFYDIKSPGHGSGLGLCIVRTVVLEHGGQVDVRSELGAGSVFQVRLPAA